MTITARLAATAMLATTLPLVVAGAAHGSDDDTIRTGLCSGSSDWKIKAKPDDGRIEVEGEIDSNKAGQSWRWVLKHNGSKSAWGTARTGARSGSFSVERKTVAMGSTHTYTFRAVNNAGGETCVAQVTI